MNVLPVWTLLARWVIQLVSKTKRLEGHLLKIASVEFLWAAVSMKCW